MKAYKFIKTIIMYGTDPDDAEQHLNNFIEQGEIEEPEWFCNGLANSKQYPDIEVEE